jgi:hypothetical protein
VEEISGDLLEAGLWTAITSLSPVIRIEASSLTADLFPEALLNKPV